MFFLVRHPMTCCLSMSDSDGDTHLRARYRYLVLNTSVGGGVWVGGFVELNSGILNLVDQRAVGIMVRRNRELSEQ